jgi:hypothetical protein
VIITFDFDGRPPALQHSRILKLLTNHGLTGLANADFNFVIASGRKMVDVVSISVK